MATITILSLSCENREPSPFPAGPSCGNSTANEWNLTTPGTSGNDIYVDFGDTISFNVNEVVSNSGQTPAWSYRVGFKRISGSFAAGTNDMIILEPTTPSWGGVFNLTNHYSYNSPGLIMESGGEGEFVLIPIIADSNEDPITPGGSDYVILEFDLYEVYDQDDYGCHIISSASKTYTIHVGNTPKDLFATDNHTYTTATPWVRNVTDGVQVQVPQNASDHLVFDDLNGTKTIRFYKSSSLYAPWYSTDKLNVALYRRLPGETSWTYVNNIPYYTTANHSFTLDFDTYEYKFNFGNSR